MQANYDFQVVQNYLGQSAIEFKSITPTIEFLKMLLQILGMYNFIVLANQNIWQSDQINVKLTAPNGTLMLHLDAQRKISIAGNKNQKDIFKLEAILLKFGVFKKELRTEVYENNSEMIF